MALNFDVNALVNGNVDWLMALSGRPRPNRSSDNVRNGKSLTHTQEGSHVLLDLADFV